MNANKQQWAGRVCLLTCAMLLTACAGSGGSSSTVPTAISPTGSTPDDRSLQPVVYDGESSLASSLVAMPIALVGLAFRDVSLAFRRRAPSSGSAGVLHASGMFTLMDYRSLDFRIGTAEFADDDPALQVLALPGSRQWQVQSPFSQGDAIGILLRHSTFWNSYTDERLAFSAYGAFDLLNLEQIITTAADSDGIVRQQVRVDTVLAESLAFHYGLGTSAAGTVGGMPVRGSAEYRGRTLGRFAITPRRADGLFDPPILHWLSGDMFLNADFESGEVSGGLNNMHLIGPGRTGEGFSAADTWHDVTFAPGTIDGNTYSGVASVVPGTAASSWARDDATGSYGGTFYGPWSDSGHETAGRWMVAGVISLDDQIEFLHDAEYGNPYVAFGSFGAAGIAPPLSASEFGSSSGRATYQGRGRGTDLGTNLADPNYLDYNFRLAVDFDDNRIDFVGTDLELSNTGGNIENIGPYMADFGPLGLDGELRGSSTLTGSDFEFSLDQGPRLTLSTDAETLMPVVEYQVTAGRLSGLLRAATDMSLVTGDLEVTLTFFDRRTPEPMPQNYDTTFFGYARTPLLSPPAPVGMLRTWTDETSLLATREQLSLELTGFVLADDFLEAAAFPRTTSAALSITNRIDNSIENFFLETQSDGLARGFRSVGLNDPATDVRCRDEPGCALDREYPRATTWINSTPLTSEEPLGILFYRSVHGNPFNGDRLNYAAYGLANFNDIEVVDGSVGRDLLVESIVYHYGLSTPSSDQSSGMPMTGRAEYWGRTLGRLGSPEFPELLDGQIRLTVDFATGKVSGGLSNMFIVAPNKDGSAQSPGRTWHDVIFSDGTVIGSRYTGVATAVPGTAAPARAMDQATGSFSGTFYGPWSADGHETAGYWTISDTSQAEQPYAASGSFGATLVPPTVARTTGRAVYTGVGSGRDPRSAEYDDPNRVNYDFKLEADFAANTVDFTVGNILLSNTGGQGEDFGVFQEDLSYRITGEMQGTGSITEADFRFDIEPDLTVITDMVDVLLNMRDAGGNLVPTPSVSTVRYQLIGGSGTGLFREGDIAEGELEFGISILVSSDPTAPLVETRYRTSFWGGAFVPPRLTEDNTGANPVIPVSAEIFWSDGTSLATMAAAFPLATQGYGYTNTNLLLPFTHGSHPSGGTDLVASLAQEADGFRVLYTSYHLNYESPLYTSANTESRVAEQNAELWRVEGELPTPGRVMIQQRHSTAYRSDGTLLDYAAYGLFEYFTEEGTTFIAEDLAPYHYGLLTPPTGVSSLPAIGTAVYRGRTLGSYSAFDNTGNHFFDRQLAGDIRLDVDFAQDSVSGLLTNMRVLGGEGGEGGESWHDVLLTGTIGDNGRYSGTTQLQRSVGAADTSAGSLARSIRNRDVLTSGTFSGAFYGPWSETSNETAGIWSITSNVHTAFGSFGAHTRDLPTSPATIAGLTGTATYAGSGSGVGDLPSDRMRSIPRDAEVSLLNDPNNADYIRYNFELVVNFDTSSVAFSGTDFELSTPRLQGDPFPLTHTVSGAVGSMELSASGSITDSTFNLTGTDQTGLGPVRLDGVNDGTYSVTGISGEGTFRGDTAGTVDGSLEFKIQDDVYAPASQVFTTDFFGEQEPDP